MLEKISQLAEKPELDLQVGGKAKTLSILKQKYFPVPEGFVILADQDLSLLNPAEVLSAVQEIGGFPVVVRSSAIHEDGSEQSYAGIYESFLHVNSFAELLEKIHLVRQSAEQERVSVYQKVSAKGEPKTRYLAKHSAKMPVLVQKQIAAVYSGVMFSVHPMSGNENEILLECTRGLADQLVSGKTIPKTYVLNSEAELLSVAGAHDWSLPQKVIRELVAYAQMLSTFSGWPQDIEWCVDENEQIWIVQSRPITKIFYRQDLGEWSNADFRDGGVSATACLPLTASLYQRVFQTSLSQYFRDIGLLQQKTIEPILCDYFYGRLYWSTSAVKKLLSRIPGFNEKEFDLDLGIEQSYADRGPQLTPIRLQSILAFLPSWLKLNKQFKLSLKQAVNYAQQFTSAENYFQQRIRQATTLSKAEFAEFFQEIMAFHFQVESDYFTIIYNSTNYQSLLKEKLKVCNQKLGLDIHYQDLISDLGEIAHLRVNSDLAQLAALRTQGSEQSQEYQTKLQEVADKYYYFSDRCLDLTVPRWGEEARQIEKHLCKAREGVSAKSGKFAQTIQLLKQKSRRSWKTQWQMQQTLKKIKVAREFLIQREAMRDLSSRLYYFVRLACLELGRRLVQEGKLRRQEDVFCIEVEKLLAATQGQKLEHSLQELAIIGHIRYQTFLHYPAPNEFGMKVRENRIKSEQSQMLQGLGCSAGVYEGAAFVATDLAQAQRIPKGAVLVTQFTEPGWTPLFPQLSAVVTEVGGVLSHAAVISREFNLPAVLNVQGATRLIKTGDRIKVDGRQGTVHFVSGLMSSENNVIA